MEFCSFLLGVVSRNLPHIEAHIHFIKNKQRVYCLDNSFHWIFSPYENKKLHFTLIIFCSFVCFSFLKSSLIYGINFHRTAWVFAYLASREHKINVSVFLFILRYLLYYVHISRRKKKLHFFIYFSLFFQAIMKFMFQRETTKLNV